MSGSRPGGKSPATARPALDALFGDAAFDPLRRALWLDALDRKLRPCLPPPLAAHARLANFSRGRLVFVVESPVWRAKLRLAAPEVLDAARSLGLDVTDVVAKVATSPAFRPERTDPLPGPRSAAARDALRDAMASLEDPPSGGSQDDS